jgi:hypothetical protein
MGKKMKIQKNIKTNLTLMERLKLAFNLLKNGNTITVKYEDPKDFESWILLKKLKENKKNKK